MKKKRVAKLVALSMVAATLLTGVNVQAKEEKVVTAMTSIDLTPELCDPVKSGPDFRLYEMIYDPLVRYGENGEIEPALAESWDISEDGTTYTFHLRKDAKFSDGTEFNADNVTIDCVQTSIGQSKILFIGTTIYQGISAQEIQLWGIQDGQWLDIPIENLETLSDGYFCFMGDGEIIVSSIADHAEIIAILNWNPDMENFLLD